jgi:Family of unknown function (DUF5320)
MPGRDGTGPTGEGPMTGASSGSCILRIPDGLSEQVQGFAGEAGWLVSFGGNPERVKEVFDMPRGDRTGPTGAGPGTGRMRGFCMGFGIPGTGNRARDFASPGRAGGGQGRRNRFLQTGLTGWQRSAGFGSGRGSRGFSTTDSDPVPGSGLETLKARAGNLEKALDAIKRRIQEMESGAEGNQ